MPTTVRVPAYTVLRGLIRVLDMLQRIYMRAVTYITPVETCETVFGSHVRCHSRDFIQRRLRFFGIYEHNLTYFTINTLRPGSVYVDIGANIGYFSLLASKFVGEQGKVIAVEADPVTFALLEENIALNGLGNTTASNVAAMQSSCTVTIERRDPYNSGSNSVAVGLGGTSVSGLPFRAIVGADLGRINFIKIDIEGSEAPILQAIFEALSELPDELTIAVELRTASAGYVEKFLRSGFRVAAVSNVYGIDYYLVRKYLRQFHEHEAACLIPVEGYNPNYSDYVFQRGGLTPR